MISLDQDASASSPDDDGATARTPPPAAGPRPTFEIRPYRASDEAAVLNLHERGFGHPWSRDLWRWRSTPAFGGETQVMGAFAPDGSCHALLAGVRLPSRCRGEPVHSLSVSNSVLDPKLGKSLLGARLFLQVVDRFVRTFGRAPVAVMYGVPIPSLVRAMTVHVGVEVLGNMLALGNDLRVVPPAADRLHVRRERALPADLESLAARCEPRDHSGVTRDRAFLQWRFVAHPQITYEIATVRGDAGDLRGLAILREGGLQQDVLTICEWLVPEDDRDADDTLLAHLFATARQRGAVGYGTLFVPGSARQRRWQIERGFFVQPTPYQMVFRAFARGIDREFLFHHWHLSVADLEFV